MARTLTQLPRTQFSGMDYSNIIEDIINLVNDNPDYNENWDDFLSSDAGRMMIELFAYIADQMATRIDWVVNENWIGTATQKRSVMRILKLIGYNFSLPVAAKVNVSIDFTGDTWPGDSFYITPEYIAGSGSFTPFSVNATGLDDTTKRFELIEYDSTNNKYNYKTGVKITDGTSENYFYEGTTYVEDFTATTDNAPEFTLANSNVIENSARVYFVNGDSTETELIKVDSFLDTNAQSLTYDDGTDIPIPYMLSVNEDNTVTIGFGSTGLLSSSLRRLAINDTVRIFYRAGGGIAGNITTQSINTTKTFATTLIGGATSAVLRPTLINNSDGVNGQTGETAEHAATYAPLTIRTADKTVSADDYDILLNAHNNILTAKVYGAHNAPTDVFDKYGVYINPLDVWCYAVPDASGWRDLTPSEYNKFQWMSLELQNYFNAVHSFTEGGFNSGDTFGDTDVSGTGDSAAGEGDTIDWNELGDSNSVFYNYIIIDTPADLKSSWDGDSQLRIKITTSGDTTQQFTNLNNLLLGDSLYITDGDTQLQITGDTNAFYLSKTNIEEGVNLTVKRSLFINIDDNGDTTINLTTNTGDTSSVVAREIAIAINKSLHNNADYDAGTTTRYGDSTGRTGVATVYEPTTAETYLRIKSPGVGDTSTIVFYSAGDSDAIATILGTNISGDTYKCYGRESLTFIKNSSESDVGKIIYELGTPNVPSQNVTYYVHYIKSYGDTSNLGIYFHDNFTLGTDPEYRAVAERMYNTIVTTGDTIPDMNNSIFQFRFTGDSTESISLYNIDNTWTITESIRPTLTGDSVKVGDSILNFGDSDFQVSFNIDGKGDTTIDVTGDSGDTTAYLATAIVANINNGLQAVYSGDTYTSYAYAALDSTGKKIVITSPTKNNSSYVKILPSTYDAMNEVFGAGIGDSGDSHVAYTTGDYYVNYDSSSNRMQLVRVNTADSNSQMPDGNFFVHSVWDRRGRGDTEDLDETTYLNYLSNKKIIGLNNVFKQPKFSTFSLAGTVYYENTYSFAEIKTAVEDVIEENYNFLDADDNLNRDFNKDVSKSRIMSLILDVTGVERVTLSYFGKGAINSGTNEENTISCDFNEIISLRESGVRFTYTSVEG